MIRECTYRVQLLKLELDKAVDASADCTENLVKELQQRRRQLKAIRNIDDLLIQQYNELLDKKTKLEELGESGVSLRIAAVESEIVSTIDPELESTNKAIRQEIQSVESLEIYSNLK